MAGATSKLQILIEAKNQASSGIKQVEGDLRSLDNAASGLSKGLSGVLAGAGVAGFAALAQNAAQATYEFAKAGAEAQRVENAFNDLAAAAGQSGDAMLSAMQEAAHGTISDTELMLSANRAMMLGVADSAEEMARLMEVARDRGKAMGESTAQAFSDLVTGLGRGSALILDNLGIVVDAATANEAYAQSLGRTSESLSEAEKKQALINAVLGDASTSFSDAGSSAEDAADSFARFETHITNVTDQLQKFLAGPAGQVISVFDVMTTMTEKQVQAYQDAITAAKNLAMGSHDLSSSMLAAAQAEGQADDVTRRLTFGLNNLSVAAADAGQHMRVMGADALAAMEQFNIAMQTSQSIMGEIGSAATQAGVLFAGKQGGDAGLAKQKAVSEELNSQVKIWKEAGYTEKEINDVLLPGMVQSLNEADRATFKVATGTAKISDEARAAQQAFDELTNTVAGVLSGALDPGVGVDPDDLLPRQDAVNEDARRLADVAVNGWASPWAEYFKQTFPEQFQEMAASNDIKTGAAIMLRNFQDGLEPELISKEKVKERVRKMLVGDANMAELATEIATELSQEMGVPMQQALEATQGAMGGGMGMGTEAATSFADGASAALDEGNGGGAFVTKFTEQMKASYSLLSQAGKDAGKLWGANFLEVVGENVPPALIKILVDLTTPGVIAALAQKGSLTGATP
jgi:hypothetical protein